MPTANDLTVIFPVGCRVRPTEEARTAYRIHFRNLDITGVVINTEAPTYSVHVSWGDGFSGHDLLLPNHDGNCWHMEACMLVRLDDTIADVITGSGLNPVTPVIVPPPIPRLHVRVINVDDRWRVEVINGNVPTKYEFIDAFFWVDKKEAKKIPTRLWKGWDFNSIIHKAITEYGVLPDAIVGAVTQAALTRQAIDSTGVFERQTLDSELQLAIGTTPTIIAIGDQLFSLQPRGVVKSGRAIAAIREKIVGAAKKQADKIRADAREESRGIINNADRQLRECRAKIDREIRDSRTRLSIPPWIGAAGLKVRKSNSDVMPMAVGIEIDTKITAWQMIRTNTLDSRGRILRESKQDVVRWTGDNIPTLVRCHYVTVWMPFDPTSGAYAYKDTRIIDLDNHYALPHIGSRCCMELDGLPTTMKNIEEYKEIETIINRGNREVNMMSLLTPYTQWHPDIINQCPKELKKLIDINTFLSSNLADSYFTSAEIIPVEVEASEVFNVDSLREARLAREIDDTGGM